MIVIKAARWTTLRYIEKRMKEKGSERACNLIFWMGSRLLVLILKMSLWPRSKVSEPLLSCILGVLPFLPNTVMNTLASVPAPLISPVIVEIVYTGRESCGD